MVGYVISGVYVIRSGGGDPVGVVGWADIGYQIKVSLGVVSGIGTFVAVGGE